MKNFFKSLKHYIDVGKFSIKLEVQRQMEYPSFLVGWMICNPIQFILVLITIWATVQNFGSLGGWNYGQIVFLYGIAIVSHGFSIVLFVQTWNMQGYIIYGEFDRYLLRPMNVYFQFSVSLFNLIGMTDLIPAVIMLIYGGILVGFVPSFVNIIQLLVILLSATFIRGAIYLAIGAISFFNKSRNQLGDVTGTLFKYTTMYPMSIYPKIIQIIFTFVIPLGFISYYPASEFLNINTDTLSFPYMWLLCAVVSFVAFGLAYALFKFGLTKYESAGS